MPFGPESPSPCTWAVRPDVIMANLGIECKCQEWQVLEDSRGVHPVLVVASYKAVFMRPFHLTMTLPTRSYLGALGLQSLVVMFESIHDQDSEDTSAGAQLFLWCLVSSTELDSREHRNRWTCATLTFRSLDFCRGLPNRPDQNSFLITTAVHQSCLWFHAQPRL